MPRYHQLSLPSLNSHFRAFEYTAEFPPEKLGMLYKRGKIQCGRRAKWSCQELESQVSSVFLLCCVVFTNYEGSTKTKAESYSLS